MCITDTARVWFATPHRMGTQIKKRLKMIKNGKITTVKRIRRLDSSFFA